MNEEDYLFIDFYEGKAKELDLLTILKNELTETGLETYSKINEWLKNNASKYLELISKNNLL